MNRKIVYSIVISACVLIAASRYLPQHIWASAAMDGASGEGFGAGGRGVGFSSTTWRSLDGMMVDEVVVAYASAGEAREDFEAELQSDGAIVKRDSSPEEGERLVKVFGNPQARTGAAKIIRLHGNEIRSISGASLKPVLAFEKTWLKL